MGERAWAALYQQSPRPPQGSLFKVNRLPTLDITPDLAGSRPVRAWDLAATAKDDGNDPDWTVGLKLHREESGRFIVTDVVRLRGSPLEVEQMLCDTARRDGPNVPIALPQDPGSAGKVVVTHYVNKLAGYHVTATPETGSKIARATPVAAQVEGGNFSMLRADWNFAFVEELREFPQGRKDDQVDALSRAFGRLTSAATPARRVSVSFVAR
jgi:predicted phage terminase large subunit-like protein